MRGVQMVPPVMYQAAVKELDKQRARANELEAMLEDYEKIKKEHDYLQETIKKLRRDLAKAKK